MTNLFQLMKFDSSNFVAFHPMIRISKNIYFESKIGLTVDYKTDTLFIDNDGCEYFGDEINFNIKDIFLSDMGLFYQF